MSGGMRGDDVCRPDRGVRIRPLPRYMHAEFGRFVDELRKHAQSHLGTWAAALSTEDQPWVRKEVLFWLSASRYLNVLWHFGVKGHVTTRLRSRRRARHRHDRRTGDPGG